MFQKRKLLLHAFMYLKSKIKNRQTAELFKNTKIFYNKKEY